ncbi:Rhs family protein [Yersinia similis]|nr:Rhs family protein [Yersinia similis]
MQHFAYDDDNRLLRAWGTGPLGEHDSHYRYDALGRRIHKSVTIKRGAEKTTRQTDFIWQGLRLLQEQHTDGNATYIYDPNESYTPLARVDQRHGETESQVYYFHTDINGTPLDVTDGEGKHRWSGKYHAWGKVTRQNVSDPRQSTVSRFAQPLRYPGQYSDDETGLHYNTFRYYDPEIGRFSTQDPIGLAGGINLYQYGPNPLGWVDPLGLAPKAPLSLPEGYKGRIDRFNIGHGTSFEVHVYMPNGKEVGIYGPEGFFNKHGTVASEVKVPKTVSDTLNGIAVDELRKSGQLPQKGTPGSRQAVRNYTDKIREIGHSGC